MAIGPAGVGHGKPGMDPDGFDVGDCGKEPGKTVKNLRSEAEWIAAAQDHLAQGGVALDKSNGPFKRFRRAACPQAIAPAEAIAATKAAKVACQEEYPPAVLCKNAPSNRGFGVVHRVIDESLPFGDLFGPRQYLEEQGVEPVALTHSRGEASRNEEGKRGPVGDVVRCRTRTIELQKAEQVIPFGKRLPGLMTLAGDH